MTYVLSLTEDKGLFSIILVPHTRMNGCVARVIYGMLIDAAEKSQRYHQGATVATTDPSKTGNTQLQLSLTSL